MTSRRVVFGLGSNLGSRASLLRTAVDFIAATPGLTLEARSWVYQTPPFGPAQPDYMNAAVSVRSGLSPSELLAAALSIERRLGRQRRERWGPRTLDIDVLWIEGESFSDEKLTVPHPELLNRAFALAPLLDVAPDARDPRTGEALATRLATLAPASPFVSFALTDHFDTEVFGPGADSEFLVRARDRADLFAAAAEALGARVVDSRGVEARVVIPIDLATGDTDSADQRISSWLSRVLEELESHAFAMRRAVVFADGPALLRGALVGEPADTARHAVKRTPGGLRVHCVEAGDWSAKITVSR